MENQNNVVIVGGVPGVGKTTVINHALELAAKNKLEIITIVFGTIMIEIAEKEYLIQDRDQLRKLPANIQKEIQEKAARKIKKIAKNKIALVDTHYAIKTGTGFFLQGLPQWVSDLLNPRLLVLIETDPNEILSRRTTDDLRLRDQDTFDAIFEHQLINKAIASSICQRNGALMAVIMNKHGKSLEAGKELFEYLQSLKK